MRYLNKVVPLQIFLIGFLLFTSNNSKASRAAGGELIYTYNKQLNQYEISLIIYNNCLGKAPLLNTYTVNYTSPTCGVSSTISVRQVNVEKIATTCKSIASTCDGGTSFGYRKVTYKGIFVPPAKCTDWILSWAECNRSNQITNIVNPDQQCLYLEALINNKDASTNSSPQFLESPPSLFCTGVTKTFNFGVFDPDTNRITYSLITPKTGQSTTVVYKSGFSATNPVSATVPTTFSADGTFKITPSQVENSVMALQVREFDKTGKLIGYVMRDFPIYSNTCAINSLPTLSGFNGTNDYGNLLGLTCAYQDHCFYIQAGDPDAGQKVTVSFPQSLPGMKLYDGNFNPSVPFSNNQQNLKIGICWKPTNADLGVKKFIITVADSNCPYIGSQTYIYSLTVNPTMTIRFPFYFKEIPCGTTETITTTISGGVPPYSYSWSSGENTPSITKSSGTYILDVADSRGCTDRQQLELASTFAVDFSYNQSCQGNVISFIPLLDTTFPVKSVLWDFGNGQTSTLRRPIVTFTGNGPYNISFTATDETNCTLTARKRIGICTPPVYTIDATDGCSSKPQSIICDNGTPIKLSMPITTSNSCNPPASVSWDFGNGSTRTNQNLDLTHTINYTTAGVYTISARLNYTGCTPVLLTKTITIRQSPDVSLSTNNYILQCDTFKFVSVQPTTAGINFRYVWRGASNIDNSTTLGVTVTLPGSVNVFVSSVGGNNCTTQLCLFVEDPLTPQFDPTDFCKRSDTITMRNNTDQFFASKWGVSISGWDFGDGTTDFTNNYNPKHYFEPDSQYVVRLYIKDKKGCIDSTFRTVITYLPYDTLKVIDDKLCFSEKINLKGPKGKSVTNYLWDFGTGEINNASGWDITADEFVQEGNPPLDTVRQYVLNGPDGYYLARNPGSKNINVIITYNRSCTKTYKDTAKVFKPLKVEGVFEGKRCAGSLITISGKVLKPVDYPVAQWLMRLYRDSTYEIPSFLDTTKTGLPYSTNSSTFEFQFVEQDENQLRIRASDSNPYRTCRVDTVVNASITNIKAPNFTFNSSCLFPQDTVYTPEVKDLYETQDSLIIDFGDNNLRYYSGKLSQPIFYTYKDTGDFQIKFKVIDKRFNCVDSIVKTKTIFPSPRLEFVTSPPCEKSPVTFTSISKPGRPGNPIDSLTWIFPGTAPVKSKLETANYTFAEGGTFNIELRAKDKIGCTSSLIQQLVVNPAPKAKFITDTANQFAFRNLQFYDLSEANGPNGQITSWLWNFGDGDTSTLQNPVHYYDSVAIYNAKLSVLNQYGCRDTLVGKINLNAYLLLPSAFSPNNEGDPRNENLAIIQRGVSAINDFKIYNRFGELVFQTNDLKQAWDGKFKGSEQPSGVYQYYINARTIYGKEIAIQGNVTLIH